MTLRSTLLLVALGLAACEAPPPPEPAPPPAAPPEVVPEPVALEGVDDLVGDWLVLEQPGAAPDDEPATVTFMPTGEYLVLNATGIVQQATYRPVEEGVIAVTEGSSTREFEYVRDGRTLTLTTPGTESTTVLERRDRHY